MKAINGLLVSLIAGSCATVALAGPGDGVVHYAQPKVAHQPVRGIVIGQQGNNGRAGNATQMDYFSNVGGENVFYANWHLIGSNLGFEKAGTDFFGDTIGPVASPGKINEIEFWFVTSDGTSASFSFDASVTIELFQTTVDFANLGSTCLPNGNDNVGQTSLGGIVYDFVGLQNYALYYLIDNTLAGAYSSGLNWNVLDGNCFYDIRSWDPTAGGTVFTRTGTGLYIFPAMNGMSAAPCSAPDFPALGTAGHFIYTDAPTVNGRYGRDEIWWFGGDNNFIPIPMLRLAGDDGCSYDISGDGFVGGVDIDYGSILIDAGCPY